MAIGKAGEMTRFRDGHGLTLTLARPPVSAASSNSQGPAKFCNPPCRLEQGKFKVSVQYKCGAAAHSNLDPGPSLPLAGTCTMALL